MFQQQIESKDLRISGHDDDGTARIVELPGHPFYLATLFIPQMSSQRENAHPLIVAYLEAADNLRRGQRDRVATS